MDTIAELERVVADGAVRRDDATLVAYGADSTECPEGRPDAVVAVATREELIAATHSVEEIRRFVQADSLGYLSVGGLHAAVATNRQGGDHGLCDGCFTGDYPIQVIPPARLRQLPLLDQSQAGSAHAK